MHYLDPCFDADLKRIWDDEFSPLIGAPRQGNQVAYDPSPDMVGQPDTGALTS